MHATQSCSTSALRAVMTSAVLITAGCQKQPSEPRVPVVPVAGTVVFDGQPTPGALVVFHPVQGTQSQTPPARGTVGDDGAFDLTTYEANDGAPPGEYKVTIEWRRLIDDNGDVRTGPNVLPERYSRPQTTDLVVRVAEGPNRLPPLQVQRSAPPVGPEESRRGFRRSLHLADELMFCCPFHVANLCTFGIPFQRRILP